MPDDAVVTDQVRELMAAIFNVDESELLETVSQDTCARWTSLNHMTLLVGLEEQFGLTLSMEEMTTMTSLPKIVAVLKQHSISG